MGTSEDQEGVHGYLNETKSNWSVESRHARRNDPKNRPPCVMAEGHNLSRGMMELFV